MSDDAIQPQFNRRVLEAFGYVMVAANLLLAPFVVWAFGWLGLVFVPFNLAAAAFVVLLYLPVVRGTWR